jgi:hypothetical protein
MSLLGKNHRKINKEQQNFDCGGTRPATGSGDGKTSTVKPEEIIMIKETWMQPYLAYMINKTLPEDTVQAKRIIRRSKAFIALQGKLYKRSITGVLQWCVTPQEGQEILKDIHAGYVDITLAAVPLQPKPFVQDFTG